MCLDYDLKPKQVDKIIAEARKRGYIRVWKVCQKKCTGWCQGTRWKKGLRKAAHLKDRDGGWYAYLTLKDARNKTNMYSEYIKTCYVKPSWIKKLGEDWYGRKVGIFTHLCFPDWKKGDMTIREFRAMARKK